MWDRRGGSITRVAETLIISVSQPHGAAAWSDGPVRDCAAETAECRTQECLPSVEAGPGVSGDGSPPASGTWLGGDRDSLRDLVSEDPATAGDGIQIICRFDSPPRPPSPPSSPPPYPPPPPPIETPPSPPTLAALSRDVSEFSSIIEIDGDSFCIRSRLAGREEPETPSEDPVLAASPNQNSERRGDSDSISNDDSESEDEMAALVAESRRFYESRAPPRWPALLSVDAVDPDASSSTQEVPGEEEGERPTSVDSGRESGTDSGVADSEEGDGKLSEPRSLEGVTQTQTEAPSPLQAKMALLRREVGSLMRQDEALFRQLLSLHDSIEALKLGGGSLSAGSSLSSLADIEEEDTISNPSTDLDRQSRLSSEADNLSLVKGDSGSERSFFSEVLHVTGISHWAKTRLAGTDGLTAEQVSPPSLQQAAPPSLRQAAPPAPSPAVEKAAPRGRHRKQGSCDSGIVDQEIRGQA